MVEPEALGALVVAVQPLMDLPELLELPILAAEADRDVMFQLVTFLTVDLAGPVL